MKFENQGAQGELFFRRVRTPPAGLVLAQDNVVGHSETGHHHVLEGDGRLFETIDPTVAYLSIGEGEAAVRHLRSWATHPELEFSPGWYEVRRQQETTPEGLWRPVRD